MLKQPTTKTDQLGYRFVARLPDLNHYLLREGEYGNLELWRPSLGIAAGSIVFKGLELEFVREVSGAYRVTDNDFNRQHCPDVIGCVFVDQPPTYAVFQEV